MDELNFQQQNVIELMKTHVADMRDTLHTLDEKAKEHINISSIIATLAAALNVSGVGGALQFSEADQRVLLSAYSIYAIIFLLSYIVRWPRTLATTPMNPTWEEAHIWLSLDKEAYFRKLLAAYEGILIKNRPLMLWKAAANRVAGILVFIEVLLIASTAVI